MPDANASLLDYMREQARQIVDPQSVCFYVFCTKTGTVLCGPTTEQKAQSYKSQHPTHTLVRRWNSQFFVWEDR